MLGLATAYRGDFFLTNHQWMHKIHAIMTLVGSVCGSHAQAEDRQDFVLQQEMYVNSYSTRKVDNDSRGVR